MFVMGNLLTALASLFAGVINLWSFVIIVSAVLSWLPIDPYHPRRSWCGASRISCATRSARSCRCTTWGSTCRRCSRCSAAVHEPVRRGLAPQPRGADGVSRLKLRVAPGAKKSGWKGALPDGRMKVAIAAPPVDGRANEALVRFVARRSE
jgi:hypothetical protein